MKKSIIVLILVWCLLGVLAVGVLVAGISSSVFRNSFSLRMDGGRELLVDQSVQSPEVDEIMLDLMSEMVSILPGEEGVIRIVQYGRNLPEERRISVRQIDSTLEVSRDGRTGWLGISWNQHSWVEVYLPESYREKLTVRLSSGTLELETDLDLSSMILRLNSGTVSSDRALRAENAEIRVSSGLIELRQLDTNVFDIEISSGNVVLESLSGSGNVDATSGNIELESVDITEWMDARVSSGNVYIALRNDPDLEFEGSVTSGHIDAYFGQLDTSSNNRNLKTTVGDAPYKRLSVQVTSGNVEIERAD